MNYKITETKNKKAHIGIDFYLYKKKQFTLYSFTAMPFNSGMNDE